LSPSNLTPSCCSSFFFRWTLAQPIPWTFTNRHRQ
jgi:hypothetical protein